MSFHHLKDKKCHPEASPPLSFAPSVLAATCLRQCRSPTMGLGCFVLVRQLRPETPQSGTPTNAEAAKQAVPYPPLKNSTTGSCSGCLLRSLWRGTVFRPRQGFGRSHVSDGGKTPVCAKLWGEFSCVIGLAVPSRNRKATWVEECMPT